MEKKLVFISHITEEKELAEFLSSFIKKTYLGMVETFVSSDEISIPSGTRWIDIITNALEHSAVQITLCSHQSIGRPWINFEAGAAWIRKIPVIPVCHSGFTVDNLPAPLNNLEACNITSEHALRKLFSVITQSLGCDDPNVNFSTIISFANDFSYSYMFINNVRMALIKLESFYKGFISAIKDHKYVEIKILGVNQKEVMDCINILQRYQLATYTTLKSGLGMNGLFLHIRINFSDKLLSLEII